mgnify:CR=1 FL=1
MKVGILLDDLTVTIWLSAVIDFIEKNPNIEIAFIAVNQSKSKGASSSIVYRALRMIDRKLFKLTGNPFKKVKLDLNLPNLFETKLQIMIKGKFYSGVVVTFANFSIKNSIFRNSQSF